MPINRRMGIEDAVYIHKGMLLSNQRGEFGSSVVRWMNLEFVK